MSKINQEPDSCAKSEQPPARLRVGYVEYLNALPLHLPFQLGAIPSEAHFIYAIPSELNALLRQQQLDLALTSSVEYFDGPYGVLPGFGIASQERCMSVNFYSQHPLTSLNGMRVGLTHQSATSITLLKILCHFLWKISPRFEILKRDRPFSHYAGLLLIGDEALAHPTLPHFQTFDLGEAWHALTALPCVFALFSCHPSTTPELISTFEQKIEAALQWSSLNRSIIEKEALKRSSLSPQTVHNYFHALHHRLGEKEWKSLECFQQLRKALPQQTT